MNWSKFRLILRRVGLVFGLGIFFYLIYKNIQNLVTLPETIHFHLAPIIFSVLLYLVVYLLQMFNLKFIYSFVHQKLSITNVMTGFSLALIPKYVPGFIWGYMSRVDWFEINNGIPQKYSWSASLIEIIVTVTSGLMIVASYLLLKINNFHWVWLGVITIPLLQFCFFQLIVIKRPSTLKKIDIGITDLSLLLWLLIFFNSLVQWILLGGALLLIQIAFSTNNVLKSSDLYTYIYIFSRSWITGFLAVFIPNGLGVRELALKDLLSLESGLKIHFAILISTVSRLVLFFVEGLWFTWANFSHKRIKTKK